MPKQLENWEKEFIRNWIAIKDFSQDDMLKYIRDQRQEAAKEIQERDRKSLEARNQPKEIKEARKFIRENPSQFEYVNKNYRNFWNWEYDQPDDDSLELARKWEDTFELSGLKEFNI